MTQKDETLDLHVLDWQPEGIEFNGIVGRPSKACFPANPNRKALPVKYDPNGHLTTIAVPAKASDPTDTVIALQYDGRVAADPEAEGQSHWYTTRSRRLIARM